MPVQSPNEAKSTPPIFDGQEFQLDHVVLEADTIFPLHEHDGAHLVMVFRGQWGARSAAGEFTVREGEALLQSRQTSHTHYGIAGTELLILKLTAAGTRRFDALYEESAGPVPLSFADLKGIPDALHAELQSRDDATPAVVEGLAIQMLALGSRAARAAGRTTPSWFPRAIEFIHANLASGLSIDTVSRAAGISASRLAHSFRAATGSTFGAYLNETRVRQAAIALRTTRHSVAEIALSVGFYDQSHFSRTFKALKRVTPLEYRRMRSDADVAVVEA